MLEQDKTVRQSFRDCLTPMAAFANIGRLSTFLNVLQENSKAWLLTFLLDKLRESAPAENIGAAIVLAHILPDTHQRVPEVQQFLSRASGSYLGAVIESFSRRWHEQDRLEVPRWFASLLLQLLTKPNWAELGADVISGAVWLLRNNSAERPPVPSVLAPQFASLLPLLFLSWHERPVEEHVAIGNLRFRFPRSADNVEEVIGAANEAAVAEDAPGIFHFIQLLLRFSKTRSRTAYVAILQAIHQAGNNLLLPLRRAIQFPLPKVPSGTTLASVAEGIGQTKDDEFTAMITAGEVRFEPFEGRMLWEFGFEAREPVTKSDLVECYNHSPGLALALAVVLSRTTGTRFDSSDTLSRFVGDIIPRLQADPAPILAVPWCWDFLMKHAPAHANALRVLVFGACRSSLPYERRQQHSPLYHRYGDIEVIAGVLGLFTQHGESSVLPQIADLILSHLRMFGVGRHVASETALPSELMSDLKKAKESLAAVATDGRLCWSIRCSAAILEVLSTGPEANADALNPVVAELVANCNSNKGEWLLDALVAVLTYVCRKQTPFVSALVRDLFESCREDYRARATLEQVLMVWREWSGAPVTSQSLRDRWLYRVD